ncbi:unnamed protein product [Caretta caretta]
MRKLDSFVVSVSADSETDKILESGSEVKSENIGVDIENIDVIKVHSETKEEIPAAVSVEENAPHTSISETTGNHVHLDIFDNTAEICKSCQSEIQSDTEISTISDDPAQWILNAATIEYLLMHGIKQNIDSDFTNSKRRYTDKLRVLTKNVFERHLLNGEVKSRQYLVYSESKGAMFCAPCRLFRGISSLTTSGYHDWKNISARLWEHENPTEHKTCVLTMVKRGEISGRTDMNLKFQMEEDIIYWRNVLKRIVAVVKKLSSRGLAFKGYINSIRDLFDMYEETAKEKSEIGLRI